MTNKRYLHVSHAISPVSLRLAASAALKSIHLRQMGREATGWMSVQMAIYVSQPIPKTSGHIRSHTVNCSFSLTGLSADLLR